MLAADVDDTYLKLWEADVREEDLDDEWVDELDNDILESGDVLTTPPFLDTIDCDAIVHFDACFLELCNFFGELVLRDRV